MPQGSMGRAVRCHLGAREDSHQLSMSATSCWLVQAGRHRDSSFDAARQLSNQGFSPVVLSQEISMRQADVPWFAWCRASLPPAVLFHTVLCLCEPSFDMRAHWFRIGYWGQPVFVLHALCTRHRAHHCGTFPFACSVSVAPCIHWTQMYARPMSLITSR